MGSNVSKPQKAHEPKKIQLQQVFEGGPTVWGGEGAAQGVVAHSDCPDLFHSHFSASGAHRRALPQLRPRRVTFPTIHKEEAKVSC